MTKIFRKESEIPGAERRIDSLKKIPMSKMTQEELSEIMDYYNNNSSEDKYEVPTLEALDNTNKLVRPLEGLFDGNLCIAESHHHISPKKFLFQNMRLLKDKGYDVLFMEHLCYREHQDLVDQYFASNEAEMPKELARYLDDLTDGHMRNCFGKSEDKEYLEAADHYNFRTILEEAKRCGLKVVCAEKDKFTYKDEYFRHQARMAVFNNNFRELVKQYEEDNGSKKLKWVLFVGNGHVNEMYGVPGICNIIPDVQEFAIFDCDKGDASLSEMKEKSFYQFNYGYDDSGFLVSALLRTPFDEDMNYSKVCLMPKQSSIVLAKKPFIPSLARLSDVAEYDDLSEDSLLRDSPTPSPATSNNNSRKRQLGNDAAQSKPQTQKN